MKNLQLKFEQKLNCPLSNARWTCGQGSWFRTVSKQILCLGCKSMSGRLPPPPYEQVSVSSVIGRTEGLKFEMPLK